MTDRPDGLGVPANAAVEFDNPFFQSLGTNGCLCGSHHQPADGWTIVPSHVQGSVQHVQTASGRELLIEAAGPSECTARR